MPKAPIWSLSRPDLHVHPVPPSHKHTQNSPGHKCPPPASAGGKGTERFRVPESPSRGLLSWRLPLPSRFCFNALQTLTLPETSLGTPPIQQTQRGWPGNPFARWAAEPLFSLRLPRVTTWADQSEAAPWLQLWNGSRGQSKRIGQSLPFMG